jgi:hypothetical protein
LVFIYLNANNRTKLFLEIDYYILKYIRPLTQIIPVKKTQAYPRNHVYLNLFRYIFVQKRSFHINFYHILNINEYSMIGLIQVFARRLGPQRYLEWNLRFVGWKLARFGYFERVVNKLYWLLKRKLVSRCSQAKISS